MAIIKCKMCGGDLELIAGSTVAECEYCGTRQTVPNADNEKKLTLFARANRLRAACDFDKAAGIYESIVADFPEESEAYWGLVLCKYGIEYVDDPATGKKIPTCHRSGFESVMKDTNFEQAQENADITARTLYREEAKQIEQLRKGIIEVSAKEDPYDIFICYKETDHTGKRTLDSVLAQDIYDALTDKGYRVFFSRISLEDKLGQEYEPYIFAALNSAKIMLAVGTNYEYYNAVWVKNEWSRYLKLMAKDKTKHLIPCYKGLDAYDMPEEFARLQAQDLGKMGAIQDILRGVEKLLPRQKETVQETVVVQQTSAVANTAPLLKRAAMFLEDSQWDNAEEYCEKVLDADPECAEAYLIKLLSGNRVNTLEKLAAKRLQMTQSVSYAQQTAQLDTAVRDRVMKTYAIPGYYMPEEILALYTDFDKRYSSAVPGRQKQRREETQWWEENYFVTKVTRFADEEIAQQLRGTFETVLSAMDERIAEAEKQVQAEKQAVLARYARLEKIVAENAELRKKKREADYARQTDMHESNSCQKLESAISVLMNLGDYKDAPVLIEQYRARIRLLEEREAAFYKEQAQRQRELAAKARKKRRVIALIALIVICVVVAAAIFINTVILPPRNYAKAQQLLCEGKTAEAAITFGKLGNYKDARGQSMLLWNQVAHRDTIFVDYETAVAIREDGTVLVAGELEGNVSGWDRCIAVCNSGSDVIALRDDGTVYNTEDSGTSRWSDIVAISTDFHILGLKSDGTVVAEGSNYYGQCKVSGWKNIIAIDAGGSHSVGLRADGTVVATGDNDCGQCNVQDWTDIVAISAGYDHTVGLKADGTVVATKYIESAKNEEYRGQCNVSDWEDIVQISAGGYYTVGLRADGLAVATAYAGHTADLAEAYYERTQVADWENLVAVAAGSRDTLGLRKDGTIVVTGSYWSIEKEASRWTDIRLP